MNAVLPVLACLLLSVCPSFSQISSGHLTYKMDTHFEWPENEANDEELSNEEREMEAGLKKMIQEKIQDGAREAYEYYFEDNLVRIIRPGTSKPSVLHFHKLKEMEELVFSTNVEPVKVDTIRMNFRVNPEWHVEYTIDTFLDDRKNILGFDCHKVVLQEYRNVSGREYRTRYEMYVTPAINFPSHVVAGLYDQVQNDCALEVRVTDLRNEKSYTLIYAVDFNQTFDRQLIVKPR